jgi:cytochrome c6
MLKNVITVPCDQRKTTMKKNLALSIVVALALPVIASAENAVYKAKCASCHGADGAGQTTIGKKMALRDLRSAEVQKQSNAELTKIISDGKGKMPAYKAKVSADELKALVAYMREIVGTK